MPLKSEASQVWVSKAFTQFTGVDTGESPAVIDEDKLSWIVNYIPTGKSSLRKVPGFTNICFLPTEKTYKYMFIGKCKYNFAFIISEDGALEVVNLDTNLFFGEIANPGTLSVDAKMTLWTTSGDGVLLIIDPTLGYFKWEYGDA